MVTNKVHMNMSVGVMGDMMMMIGQVRLTISGKKKTTDATECQSTTMLGREDKNTHINDGHHR